MDTLQNRDGYGIPSKLKHILHEGGTHTFHSHAKRLLTIRIELKAKKNRVMLYTYLHDSNDLGKFLKDLKKKLLQIFGYLLF